MTTDMYTITFRVTRSVSEDWINAVVNDFHQDVTSREALRAQIVAELADCIEHNRFSGVNIEVVGMTGNIDNLDPDNAFDEEDDEAA